MTINLDLFIINLFNWSLLTNQFWVLLYFTKEFYYYFLFKVPKFFFINLFENYYYLSYLNWN